MVDAGTISGRALFSNEGRDFLVYSLADCNQNFRDYLENRTGSKRGRTAVNDRPRMLRLLAAKGRPKIAYEDAIGAYEAAKILGVYWTFMARLAKNGHIVGRILHSGRSDRSRLWIFSRKSCEARAVEIAKLEKAGKKIGRPRSYVDR
jgi:hypothetical protein